MKKIYLVYLLDLDSSQSFVLRVFSKESHARAYCDYKTKHNISSNKSFYYDSEELLLGRTADYFLRTLFDDKFE